MCKLDIYETVLSIFIPQEWSTSFTFSAATPPRDLVTSLSDHCPARLTSLLLSFCSHPAHSALSAFSPLHCWKRFPVTKWMRTDTFSLGLEASLTRTEHSTPAKQHVRSFSSPVCHSVGLRCFLSSNHSQRCPNQPLCSNQSLLLSFLSPYT